MLIEPSFECKVLDLLRTHSSLGALVDANERYDPPRCMEGTRLSVMRKLENWIQRDRGGEGNPSSIFWLYGGVGAGTSAIAQTLAEKFKKKGDLAAGFFFKADGNRNDGNRLIPTLVYELIHSFPGVTPLVEEKIFQNPDLFKKTRRRQMFDLFVDGRHCRNSKRLLACRHRIPD